MSLEWIPGVGASIAASLLVLWRGAAVMEERVKELRERADKYEHATELLEDSVHGQIGAAVMELNQIATQLKVTIAEQSAFNKVNTKTLEGLVNRVEAMGAMVYEHDKQIAIINERCGASGE